MKKDSAHKIIDDGKFILFLGDADASECKEFIENNNIKAIVNCTPDLPCVFKGKVEYLRLPIEDSLKDVDIKKMIKMLPDALKFINNHHKKGNNVFVHCVAGMQRSVTVVTAYLCHQYHIPLTESVNYILQKRPQAFHHGKHLNFYESLIYYKKVPQSQKSLSLKGNHPSAKTRVSSLQKKS